MCMPQGRPPNAVRHNGPTRHAGVLRCRAGAPPALRPWDHCRQDEGHRAARDLHRVRPHALQRPAGVTLGFDLCQPPVAGQNLSVSHCALPTAPHLLSSAHGLWVVPYAGQNPAVLVGGAPCWPGTLRPLHCPHCPPTLYLVPMAYCWCPRLGGALCSLTVTCCAEATTPFPTSPTLYQCLWVEGGALFRVEPSHNCGWWPTLVAHLQLVGGVLCSAEPTHTCRWCPTTG